jgi:hypothetical protein
LAAVGSLIVASRLHPQPAITMHNRPTVHPPVFHGGYLTGNAAQCRLVATVTQCVPLLIDSGAARFSTTARF